MIFFNLKSIGVKENFSCVDWGIFFVARISYTQKQNQNVSQTASRKQIDQWLCTICDALAHVAPGTGNNYCGVFQRDVAVVLSVATCLKKNARKVCI